MALPIGKAININPVGSINIYFIYAVYWIKYKHLRQSLLHLRNNPILSLSPNLFILSVSLVISVALCFVFVHVSVFSPFLFFNLLYLFFLALFLFFLLLFMLFPAFLYLYMSLNKSFCFCVKYCFCFCFCSCISIFSDLFHLCLFTNNVVYDRNRLAAQLLVLHHVYARVRHRITRWILYKSLKKGF